MHSVVNKTYHSNFDNIGIVFSIIYYQLYILVTNDIDNPYIHGEQIVIKLTNILFE